MTLSEVQVKWSLSLMDRLDPDIFSTLRMKGQCFPSCARAFEIPGGSPVWNALLTERFPMFLSHLVEINKGCKKILPISGSFWSNFKLFRRMDFTAWLWGWNVRVDELFYHYSPSGTSQYWPADQFVGRDDGSLKQQRQVSHVAG